MEQYVNEVTDVDTFIQSIMAAEMLQEDVANEINRLESLLCINSGSVSVNDTATRSSVDERTSHSKSSLLFKCPGSSCGNTFSNKKALDMHMERLKGKSCFNCGKHFNTVSLACRHRKNNCKERKSCKSVYHCAVCKKTWGRRVHFTNHQKYNKCVPISQCDSGGKKQCPVCQKTFLHLRSHARHMRERNRCKGPDKQVQVDKLRARKHETDHHCVACQKTFKYKSLLKRHNGTNMCLTKRRQIDNTTCSHCDKQFSNAAALQRHVTRGKCNRKRGAIDGPEMAGDARGADGGNFRGHNDPDGGYSDDDTDFGYRNQRQSALHDSVVRYTLTPVGAEVYDVHLFFGNRKHKLANNVAAEQRRKKGIKWYMCLNVKMCKYDATGELVDTAHPFFRTKTFVTLNSHDTDRTERQLNEGFFKMSESLELYRRSGSGWIMEAVQRLEQNATSYVPLRGACANCELPEKLKTKNDCLLNVDSGASKRQSHCFKYCVLASLYPLPEKSADVENYEHYDKHWHTLEMNTADDTGHMPVSSIPEFEHRNRVSINVIGYGDTFFPLHISDKLIKGRHVNLLLISRTSGESDSVCDNQHNESHMPTLANAGCHDCHYVLITDMNKLLSKQYSNDHRRMYFCVRCLNAFLSAHALAKHEKLCTQHEPLHVKMPSDDRKCIRFRHRNRELKVKFIIVAKFSCISKKQEQTADYSGTSTGPNALIKHEPCAFTYYRLSVGDKYPKQPCVYVGNDCMDVFLDCMKREETEVLDIISRTHPPVFTENDLRRIESSRDICHICEDPFLPGEIRVLSHSHYDGYLYGFAHQGENLNYKEADFLPVLCSGFSNYDSRLILSAVGKYGQENVQVIPKTIDTYISMTVGKCRYLDVSRFLREDITSYVSQVYHDMGIGGFPNLSEHTMRESGVLFLPKTPFCDYYLDNFDRLAESNLPGKCDFYDPVTETCIDDVTYGRVTQIWTSLGLQTLEDLLRVHLLSETLIMADIWTHFRDHLINSFKLDPTHYVTLSQYAWDCALKLSETTIELLTDQSMHLFVESAVRGGFAFVGSPRFAKANSELIGDDYDSNENKSYLCYFDVNSLFAHVMNNSYLPVRSYRWLEDFELDRLHVFSIPPNADKGLILDVDLDYPNDLHDTHDTFPLASEKIPLTESDLSPYMREVSRTIGISPSANNTRLVATLRPKRRYVLHYLNLQFYLQHGMVLKRIHRALEFTQSPWLAPYISLNLKMRKDATSSMARQLHKDMSNVIYGKCLQSSRDKLNVKLVTSDIQLKKLVSLPTFVSCRVLHDNLVAVHMRDQSVVLDKPILTGMSILDLSKLYVYRLHYTHFLPRFSSGARKCDLLMSDTDSLLYRFQGIDDLYSELKKMDADIFDFSTLDGDHPLYSEEGSGVSGRLKLELGDSVIMEFCGLSAKCYSILTDKTCKIAAKSLSESASRRFLTHDRYKQCLLSDNVCRGDITRIETRGLGIYTTKFSNRTLISSYNDKRFFVDKLNSYSYGNHQIVKTPVINSRINYLDFVYDMHRAGAPLSH